MYCGNCGTDVQNGVAFCPNCGAKMGQAVVKEENVNIPGQQSAPGNGASAKIKQYLPIGAAVVAIGVVIAIIVGIFGGGYKKTIKKYYKAIEKQDVQMMKNCLSDLIVEVNNDGDEDSINDNVEYFIEYRRDDFGMESDSKISYKILESTKLKKDKVKELNEEIQERLKSNSDPSYDYTKYKVTAAVSVTVKETVKTDGEEENYRHDYILLKENGKWHMLLGSADSYLY